MTNFLQMKKFKPVKSGTGLCKYGIVVLLVNLIHIGTVAGQDAQWRGPNRDGIFTGTSLLKEWPADGPEIIFSTEGIGRGFSSTVATKDRIYATGTSCRKYGKKKHRVARYEDRVN